MDHIISDAELLWPGQGIALDGAENDVETVLNWPAILMAGAVLVGAVAIGSPSSREIIMDWHRANFIRLAGVVSPVAQPAPEVRPPAPKAVIVEASADALQKEGLPPLPPLPTPIVPPVQVPVDIKPASPIAASVRSVISSGPAGQLPAIPVPPLVLPAPQTAQGAISPPGVGVVQAHIATTGVQPPPKAMPTANKSAVPVKVVAVKPVVAPKVVSPKVVAVAPITSGCEEIFRRGIVSSTEIGLKVISKDVAAFQGCTVRAGTPIGDSGEKVQRIDPDKLVVHTNRRVLTIVD